MFSISSTCSLAFCFWVRVLGGLGWVVFRSKISVRSFSVLGRVGRNQIGKPPFGESEGMPLEAGSQNLG